MGHSCIAKAHTPYREQRSQARPGRAALDLPDDLKLSINAVEVLKRRYLLRDETGRIVETPSELFGRVARHVAQAEANYGTPAAVEEAQRRFYEMMDAWKAGDIGTVGRIFREDGIGLRDQYRISGPELETMCDIVRTVEGVLGERMLGGGDKGAAGCLVRADAVDAVRRAVETAYPRSRPAFADKFAVHTCKVVDGVKVFDGAI